MSETTPVPVAASNASQPPESFLETMQIPESGYRTAIAIKNAVRMVEVKVTFHLKAHADGLATYSAVCPRCHAGEITAVARLNADDSLAEHPACPTLCLACEDRLDAILEPQRLGDLENEPQNRETLNKYIKGMARPWE